MVDRLDGDRHDSERLRGIGDGLTDRWTDICDCRVAFTTDNNDKSSSQKEKKS